MTDKSKTEDLTNADLDGVQGGGYINVEHDVHKGASRLKQADAKLSRDRAKPYIGETEKNIVAQGGDGSI